MQFKITVPLILSLFALEASAFWRLPCQDRVLLERSDPIVNPGTVAGHVHTIHGSNAFSMGATNADLMKGTCSSCQVKEDLSSYWTPALYFEGADGKQQVVPQTGGMLVYYLQRGENVVAVPAGLRMLAGDPTLRSFNFREIEKSLWTDADRTQDALAQKAIGYNCLNYNAPAEAALGLRAFPDNMGRCKDGLRAEVFFPSCWDGKNLDSADHKSHMAYPSLMDDGVCPPTHPIRVVSLFFETIWNVAHFAGQSGRFVFSNGDPTGYGNHGDFMNGWQQDVLERAVKECRATSGIVEECKHFTHYTLAQMQQCEAKKSVEEDVFGPFAKLPGCNPVQLGPNRAAKMNCDDPVPVPPVSSAGATTTTITSTSLTTLTTSTTAAPVSPIAVENENKEVVEEVKEKKKPHVVVVTVTSTTTLNVYAQPTQGTQEQYKRHNHYLAKRVHQHHRS
ncbi:hypothetical protein DFH27DRAFT_591416 [Peziza echinospora]|nr:hypothetical protein DFH27DRAFT_591416 [Peziza echinospora]